MSNSFDLILHRAIARKGGREALDELLPKPRPARQLIDSPDSFFLAEMTRSVFQSGFVWRVIDNKWPSFHEAFLDFDLNRLMALGDAAWGDYLYDARIVRHRQKINALRHNVWFVHEISTRYDGFGRFLAQWPTSDLVGLFSLLKKNGSRLGGSTGQYFLQHVGLDSFALTRDVVCALQLHGLRISDQPASQKDLQLVQRTFDEWHEASGLSYLQLSHVLAFSVGENTAFADLQINDQGDKAVQ